jgi:hypothetical protein
MAHPLDLVLDRAAAGDTAAVVAPLAQPSRYIMHKLPRVQGVECFRVNAATAALVAACDGTRTVAEVTESLAARFGGALAERTAAAVRMLHQAGVIGLREGR